MKNELLMPTTMDTPGLSLRLRAIDPDLPMLAAASAVELENYHSTGEAIFEAVPNLAVLLKNSFRSGGDMNAPKSLLDASTMSLVGRAFNSAKADKISTVNQLSTELQKLADQLERVVSSPSGQPIEEIRDFCVALSESATTYRQSLYDLKPSHPSRR